MNTKIVASGCCLLFLAGCGGSKDPAGHDLAAKACQSSGQAAADYAAQAAAANSLYAGLAADEKDAAAQESDAGAAAGLGSGAAAQLLTGQGAGFKVIGDCVKLGLQVTPAH